jgi:hypothetical protein
MLSIVDFLLIAVKKRKKKERKRICIVYKIDIFFKNKYSIPIRMNKKIFGISFFCIIKK